MDIKEKSNLSGHHVTNNTTGIQATLFSSLFILLSLSFSHSQSLSQSLIRMPLSCPSLYGFLHSLLYLVLPFSLPFPLSFTPNFFLPFPLPITTRSSTHTHVGGQVSESYAPCSVGVQSPCSGSGWRLAVNGLGRGATVKSGAGMQIKDRFSISACDRDCAYVLACGTPSCVVCVCDTVDCLMHSEMCMTVLLPAHTLGQISGRGGVSILILFLFRC